ncbi:sensor histidine kinase [Isoptericola croceus]|uniref:sensor histidine kinase n=1 Tax=Isoptericola croceus TaxID=3031406 RepID=UPI0023F70138|nr:ATP-binding protein [Isoptericola croceus]
MASTATRTARARRGLSLASQFLILQLCIVLLAVAAVAATSVAGADAAFRNEEGQRLLSAAENLAATSVVRNSLAEPGNEGLRSAAGGQAETTRIVYGAGYVLVATIEATVHADTHGTEGQSVPTEDSPVASGQSWVGVRDDGAAHELVSHVPVLHADTGEILGFVVVAVKYPTPVQLFADAVPNLLVYLLLGGAIGVVGSLLLARRVTRQTLGLEPREIAGLVEHREAMLYGIKEGVVGIDAAGRVTIINDEAVRLLGLPDDGVGTALADLPLEESVLDVLAGRVQGEDHVVVQEDRVLVLNRMPVLVRGRDAGAVATLRDRTELTSLRRELDDSRTATDTLRAQAHEFSNRLHTIAGLVELGEFADVARYIHQASELREKLVHEVVASIGEPALAALLIAKSSLAVEQGARLHVTPDSALPPVGDTLAYDLVTVVGNLVDNAIDAIEPGGWVEVTVSTTGTRVDVIVRDSGPGIPASMVEAVFRQGVTTKDGATGRRGAHQGIGLALVRMTCQRRGGGVEAAGSTLHAWLDGVRPAPVPADGAPPPPTGTEAGR